MTTEHTLTAHALTVGYQDRSVIESLDLLIPPGEITAIAGANACGKSTLLRALSRLLRPHQGRVLLDGGQVHRMRAKQLARTLGLLPQPRSRPTGSRSATSSAGDATPTSARSPAGAWKTTKPSPKPWR